MRERNIESCFEKKDKTPCSFIQSFSSSSLEQFKKKNQKIGTRLREKTKRNESIMLVKMRIGGVKKREKRGEKIVKCGDKTKTEPKHLAL